MTFYEHLKNAIKRAVEGIFKLKLEDKKLFVVNKEKNTKYQIFLKDNEVTGCSCPHHKYRKAFCKHMAYTVEQLPKVNIADSLISYWETKKETDF